jgi:hypothetical protein
VPVAHASILATWDAEIWRTEVQDKAREIVHKTPSPKIIRAKWTGNVTQAVECLLANVKP